MERFRDYYRQLSLREQMLLILAALVLVVVGGYVGLVQPLLDRRAAATSQLAERRDLYAWMMQAAREARQFGPAAAAGAAGTIAPATPAAIEQSLRGRGLSPMVVRLEPTPDGIDIDLKAAPLNAVVAWIAEAEGALGYDASDADLVRGPEPGTADVRLRLAPKARP